MLRPIVHAPVIAAAIRAAGGIGEQKARYDACDTALMVDLAAEQITDDRQNIYTILLALQRWCEDLELSAGEARKVSLFCIVGDPERGLDPLEQFRYETILARTRLCSHGTCVTTLALVSDAVCCKTPLRRRRFLWTLRGIPGLLESVDAEKSAALQAAHQQLSIHDHD